jgi:hypothetical protein
MDTSSWHGAWLSTGTLLLPLPLLQTVKIKEDIILEAK